MIILNILLSNTLIEEQLSQKVQFHNWGFILFLICFFITIYSLSKGIMLLQSMMKNLFKNNNNDNVFIEPINNDLLIRLFLGLQTIILSALFLFVYFSHHQSSSSLETNSLMFQFLIGTSFLLIIFLLYKFLSYNLVGNVFFKKEEIQQWNEHFASLICISGLILFLPILFMFYVDSIYVCCYYFCLIYFIFITFLTISKAYLLFFHQKSLSLYFILYLCAQEMIPAYFLYRGLDYLFIIVQRDTLLWLPT